MKIAGPGKSSKVRDSLIATKDGRLLEVFGQESDPWKAYEVRVEPFEPNIGLQLPWSKVGVHK